MTPSDRLLKIVLILIGLVLFCITTYIFFGYGVVQAIENTGVMFAIHILMCFCIFRTSLFSLYAWIRYSQLRTEWGFWRVVMVHIFTACVAFWFFVEILSIQQWWSWLLLIPPIWLSLFQCVLYTDLKRMIRDSETPEHEKAVEKHGMKHTIQFFLKWMGVVVNVVLVVLLLWQFLWKGSLSHMILGGIAFLVIFLFFRVPVVNIRAWIRYPQLRTEWGFWLCSCINLFLIFFMLVLCMGWAATTPDIFMREFPFYAFGHIFVQLTVYIALNEMIKHCKKQKEKGKKWENILPNPEKWLHSEQ